MISSVTGLPAIVIDKLGKTADFETGGQDQNNINKHKAEMLKVKNAEAAHAKEAENQQPNYEELAARLQKFLGDKDMIIEFRLDKETKKMIMRIIDNKSKEVMQQLPPELTLKIARIVASTLGNGQVTNAKV